MLEEIKIYIERFTISYTRHAFFIGIGCDGFVLARPLTKVLLEELQESITKYEEKYELIDTNEIIDPTIEENKR